MTGRVLPPYIERPAPIAAQPPGFIGDAWVYAFGFPTSLDAVTRLCDAYLNPAATGGLSYQPALPFAVLTFMWAKKVTSARPYGWMDEQDCAFWLPLLATEMENGRAVARRLVWWMPYVFVDTDAAMATGREIWGYPKSIGTFTFPDGPEAAAPVWRLSTRVFATLSPETEGVEAPLVTIVSAPGAAVNASTRWRTVADAAGDVLAIIRRELEVPLRPSLALAESLLDTLLHHEMQLVNLKQFRDCADPTRACYQAIVEGPCTVQTWHAGGMLQGRYHLSIADVASHPIIGDLGLASGEVEATYAAWCHMDFQAMPGREVSGGSVPARNGAGQ